VTFRSVLSVGGKRKGIVEEDIMDDVFFPLVFIFVETVGV